MTAGAWPSVFGPQPTPQPGLAPPGPSSYLAGQQPAPGDAYPGSHDPNGLSSEEWAYLSQLLGYDAYGSYQSFIQNYVIAAQHRAQATKGKELTSGYDSVDLWTTGAVPANQDQALTQGWSLTAANRPAYGIGADQYTPSPKQFQYFVLHSTYGAAGIIAQQAANAYAADYGQAMPDDLRQQILQAIQAMPDAERQQLMQMYGGTTPGSSAAAAANQSQLATAPGGQTLSPGYTQIAYLPPAVQNLITSYDQEHPAPSSLAKQEGQRAQAARSRLIDAFQKALGRLPTDQEISELLNASDQQLNDYINSQPAPGGAGINYGNYTYQQDRLAKAGWQKYFGHTPTAKEIVWAMGQTDLGIQQYIDSSPSHHDGMTIGELEGTQKFASDLSTQYFGYDDPTHLLAVLGGSPSTSTAAPMPAVPKP